MSTRFESKLINSCQTIDSAYGEVMTPVYLTLTFAFKRVDISSDDLRMSAEQLNTLIKKFIINDLAT